LLGDVHSLCRSGFRASVRKRRGLSRLFLEKHTSSTSLRGCEYSCGTYFSDIAHHCSDVDADAHPGCDTYGSSPNPNAHVVNDADACTDSGTYGSSPNPNAHAVNDADACSDGSAYGSSPNPNAYAVNDADACSDGSAYSFTDAVTYCSGNHTLTWKR
jgi:hypothetical protein